ncbi:Transcription elongation factor SPT5 [Hypsizygus marmoreus]|uniref:Chromatin elongation factor SPT5 n=1 Tax=Hypsizygus marmoreus TaxID=39966 RepID=A0A369K6Z5_HYPMA|nr:Transcription elongation factor SPT5 [Hypsizygus marmoreus]
MTSHISKFLDIEAAVGDSSDESDIESDLDFLQEDNANETGQKGAIYRWSALDDWSTEDDSPDFLRAIAKSIEDRHNRVYSRPPHELEHESSMHILPSEGDLLWRIRVKPGSERDVILAIMQKSLLLDSAPEVQAVFSRDGIHGSVYAEASTKYAVESVLRGIPDVARRSQQGTFLVEVVDILDRPLLLDVGRNSYQPTLLPNHWARVKRGRYKHDLCLIRSVNPRTFDCEIMLVPRLHLGKKRKRSLRPPQRLFDRDKIVRLYGEKSVMLRNSMIIFREREYSSGLYHTSLKAYDLTSEGVNATEEELKYFHVDKALWSSAEDFVTPVKIGDKIRVIRGELQGTVGRVVGFKEMMITITTDGPIGPQDVTSRDIRKIFDLGDFVQVVYSPNRGASGFIVGLDQEMALIYSRVVGILADAQHDLPGSEIPAALEHIDWKATPGVVYNGTSSVVPSTLLNEPRKSLPSMEHPSAEVVRMGPRELPSPVNLDDFALQKMHTGDRYRNMEVVIVKGDAKCHFGMIKGTHQSSTGDTLVEVMTATRTVNTLNTYEIKDLRERHTGLQLERARWIPPRYRKAPTIQNDIRPKPPTPSHAGVEADMDFSVDSLVSMTPQSTTDDAIQTAPQIDQPIGPKPGVWLRQFRLINRKLDVRIQGTTGIDSWQDGKYEGQEGFLVLVSMPYNIEDSIFVKIGYTESRIRFKARHIFPQTTTAVRSTLASASSSATSVSIISVPGIRVVIIGPDLTNSLDLIGNYALVVPCPYPLQPDQASVQIASPGTHWGTYAYFHVTSLCHSDVVGRGPVIWEGKVVP